MRWSLLTLVLCLILALSACSTGNLNEQEITEIAWQAIEPNTSSHNQNAWEVVEMRNVKGKEVQALFEGEPVSGNCLPGPKSPENAKVSISGSYWYVQMKPRFATSEPIPTEQYSPTAPPSIPEPFFHAAHLLIELNSGEVVARKFYCIIY